MPDFNVTVIGRFEVEDFAKDRAELRSSRVRICPKIRAAPQQLLSCAPWTKRGEREKQERLVKSKSIEPITPTEYGLH